MITRLHGIERHKTHSTVAAPDRKGEEVDFQPRCIELKAYKYIKYIMMKTSKKGCSPGLYSRQVQDL